jgi:hypothetical protein
MRIYTVTEGERAMAVVRATDPTDAIETALDILPHSVEPEVLGVRDPNDAEMVGWLERRADFVLEPTPA